MKIVKWSLIAELEDGSKEDISLYLDEFTSKNINYTCDYWEDEHYEITENEETL